MLTKLNSHCWSCSIKIQAWKIPCFCVRPQLHKIEKWLLVLNFKSFILPKFPQTFLVACWRNRFQVKSFQLVDCCCVVLNKLNSHCWICSVKIQAWKIPCICVRPQDREMAACVSVQVVYIAKISTDISRCVLTRSLRSSKFSVGRLLLRGAQQTKFSLLELFS